MILETEIDGLRYSLDTDEQVATVIECIDRERIGEIIIPNSFFYEGIVYEIIGIGENAFRDCINLEAIIIPKGTKYIGKYALKNCNSIKSITIPKCVSHIEWGVFSGCTSLKELVFEDGHTHLSLSNQYSNSNNKIRQSLFHDCPLEMIYLGRNLKYDKFLEYNHALFYKKENLITIVIGDKVTSIGWNAFYGCSNLKSIIVGERNSVYDSRNNCNAIIETQSNSLIIGCSETSIPSGVINIKSYAFYNCCNLTSIVIPNSVTEIGESVFEDCTSITSINIPNSIVQIGRRTFKGCSSLKKVVFEDGKEVLTLGYNRFYNGGLGKGLFCDCPLETIHLGRNLNYWTNSEYGYSPFYNNKMLTSVIIGDEVTSIGYHAFHKCCSLNSVTISKKSQLMSIESSAFYDCYSLTSINIPNSVTSIGWYAFNGCRDLTDIIISENSLLTSIGMAAFRGCSSLTAIYIPNGVTSLDVFYGCHKLTSIIVDKNNKTYDSRNCCNAIIKTENNTLIAGCSTTIIPNGVERIERNAFDGHNNLTSITIPCSVVTIGDRAFDGCTSLKELIFEDGDETLILGCDMYTPFGGDDMALFYDCPLESVYLGRNLNYTSKNPHAISPFYNKSQLKSVTIGQTVTKICNSMFCNCSNITSIDIPRTVTNIGNSAFAGCVNLTDITIPNEVIYIEMLVFSECRSLTAITFAKSIEEIAYRAFLGCSSLSHVIIPSKVKYIQEEAFKNCGIKFLTLLNSTVIMCDAFEECEKLTDIYCYSEETPPAEEAFGKLDLSPITLHVPENAIEAYKNTEPWCRFGTIVSIK